MFQAILSIVLVIISISIFICFIRTLIGPTMPDRIVALDSLGINLIGLIGIVMLKQESLVYAEVILVISILAFIGTIALSKFMERGVVFERD